MELQDPGGYAAERCGAHAAGYKLARQGAVVIERTGAEDDIGLQITDAFQELG